MNYIAHIHLARHSQTSMLGNFLGDFVKGSDLSALPPDIQYGVRLHRKIDTFTDAHAGVKALKSMFPSSLRRMSGVVLDIYFDHLLICHWSRFNDYDYSSTLAQFYALLAATPITLASPRFAQTRESLLRRQWLADYRHVGACLRAMKSVERRLSGRIVFAEQALLFLRNEHVHIEREFCEFYPQLMSHVIQLTKGNTHGC